MLSKHLSSCFNLFAFIHSYFPLSSFISFTLTLCLPVFLTFLPCTMLSFILSLFPCFCFFSILHCSPYSFFNSFLLSSFFSCHRFFFLFCKFLKCQTVRFVLDTRINLLRQLSMLYHVSLYKLSSAGNLKAQVRFAFSSKDGFSNRVKNGESYYVSKQINRINAHHKSLLEIRVNSLLINTLQKLCIYDPSLCEFTALFGLNPLQIHTSTIGRCKLKYIILPDQIIVEVQVWLRFIDSVVHKNNLGSSYYISMFNYLFPLYFAKYIYTIEKRLNL